MTSKRAPLRKPRDWAALHDAISLGSRECLKRTGVDFDEHYVVALQEAIDGRNPAYLFQLLEEGRAFPPPLGPILVEWFRSDGRGTPELLTFVDDELIRSWVDGTRTRKKGNRYKGVAMVELAELKGVSVDTIKRSERRTRKSAKKSKSVR